MPNRLSHRVAGKGMRENPVDLLLRRPFLLWKPIFEFSLWLLVAAVLPGKSILLLHGTITVLVLKCTPLRGLQLLMIQFLLVNTNPVLTGGFASSGGLHLVTAPILFARCISQPSLRVFLWRDRLTRWMLMVFPLFFCYQILTSIYPMLSALKIATYFLFVITVLTLARWSFSRNRFELYRFHLGSILFLILASLGSLPMGIGYSFDGMLFNGILNHPNVLGVWLGIGVSWLIVMTLSRHQISWIIIGISGCGAGMIYLSGARGGLFIMLSSLSIYLLLTMQSTGWQRNRYLLPRMIVVIILGIGITVQSKILNTRIESFVIKKQLVEKSLMGIFREARGGAIEIHLNLFKEKPWTGHGFQVVNVWTKQGFSDDPESSNYGLIQEELIRYDPVWKRIPITAPVESGFMYTSILAENGILGALGAYTLIIGLVVLVIRNKGREEIILIIAFLLSNVSEASLFSASGIGSWGWILMGLSYAAAKNSGISRSSSQRDVSRIMNAVVAKE